MCDPEDEITRTVNVEREENVLNRKCGKKILTNEQAVDIYIHKMTILQSLISNPSLLLTNENPLRGRSMSVSLTFDISSKTVRDIWNRRIWQNATKHLWTAEETLISGFDCQQKSKIVCPKVAHRASSHLIILYL